LMPEAYAVAYDPIETLTYVAARTDRIRLGTSILVAPFHVPGLLAKRLATLGRFSGGRVVAGLGLGWAEEEFDTAGVAARGRGARLPEFIAAMRAAWGPDPVRFEGRHYRIPESQINPKPVQPGGPRVIIAAREPAAVERAARIGDGLNAIPADWAEFERIVAGLRAPARTAGRDPGALPVIVRTNTTTAATAARDAPGPPSVNAQDKGVKDCAQVLPDLLRRLGTAAEILPTATQPIVFGEIVRDAAAYTLLCYGHYDVQPPEPLDLWQTPPFEPAVRDGRLYGRGTGDNKGQLIAHVLAAHAWLEAAGGPPINLKFVFEGEEESGSPSLAGFIRAHKSRLAADLVYISDGGLHPSGAPTISLGNRGILGLTLVARGADRDNHSGNKGGVAP